jgi:tetratricopeptide (TPR) repeat protein
MSEKRAMELTIEQVLQKAVESHKAGKLQDAESLYRAILQIQPDHPDANHNLGIIAVSLNKTEAALPLFKIALEVNPNQGQFWLSYVDALIKEKQFDNARSVLDKGKWRGLAGEKVEALEAKLTRSPPLIEINALLEHYEKGRYDLAQNLAINLTQQYPSHPFSWKMLGALFKQTGKLQDSVIANQKVLEISPNDAEAHSNLGVTHKDLGRLEEAETNYKKAIAIKPDYSDAHYNLGNILKELGRLEEAESSYKKAIAIKPDYADAHNNLGITLQELGRLEEAESSYKKAISIKPEFAQAHYNLGILLYEAGRYDLASKILELIKFEKSQSYLLKCLYLQNKELEFYKLLDYLISQGDVDPIIGSLTCRAEIKYGLIKSNSFCQDPFKYVLKIDLSKSYDFSNIFIGPVTTIFKQNKRPYRLQKLLTNGSQTPGNLFNIERDSTNEIEKIIRIEIEKYRTYFNNSEEGLIKKWPAEYILRAWLINMKSGGKLRPHMHEDGWISGSIYINVPTKTKTNSGNLVICIDDQDYLVDGKTLHEKIIDVTTGSMCLFPASLLHYTIPFESDQERIVLAFDVIPKYN